MVFGMSEPRTPCIYHDELSQNIKDLRADVTKIRECMIAGELKQSFEREDAEKIALELGALVVELKKTKQEFSKEIYEMRLLLSKEYVEKVDVDNFQANVIKTLDNLNNKIDESNRQLRIDMRTTFWKMVGTSIALGGLMVSVFSAIMNLFP